MIRTPWLGTFSGKKLDILNPHPNQIDLNDIARGLATECRYSGQIRRFYSVAEHSIQVARAALHHARRDGITGYLQEDIVKQALLHDAAEAYIRDIPTPLKSLLPEYKAIENRLIEVIFERFNVGYPMHSIVKTCDARIISDEKAVLFDVDTWPEYQEKFPPLRSVVIHGHSPEEIMPVFLQTCRTYGIG